MNTKFTFISCRPNLLPLNVYDGGYCPVGISFEERTFAGEDKEPSRLVDETLLVTCQWSKALTAKVLTSSTTVMPSWNLFYDSGIKKFQEWRMTRMASFGHLYGEDIIGPMLFDYGYGPFRGSASAVNMKTWLQLTMQLWKPDRSNSSFQDRDNYNWILDAEKNQLVVGYTSSYSTRLHGPSILRWNSMNSFLRQDWTCHDWTWPPRRIWYWCPFREIKHQRWIKVTWHGGSMLRW